MPWHSCREVREQLETAARDRDSLRQQAQRAERERAAAEKEAQRLAQAAKAGRAAQAWAEAAGATQQPRTTVVQEVDQEEERGGPIDEIPHVSTHARTCLPEICSVSLSFPCASLAVG